MNDVVSNTALLHDSDFDAAEICPVPTGDTGSLTAGQPFSWMALLNQIPTRLAFFLGVGFAVIIMMALGFLVTLSLLWNA